MSLGLALVAFVATWALLRSRIGLGLTAMRDNEEAAGSAGVDLVKTRVLCFLWTAPFLGLAGVMTALEKLRVAPSASFNITDWTIDIIFIVVIGGIGSLEGPILGAVIFFVLRQWLADFGAWYLILLGIISIARDPVRAARRLGRVSPLGRSGHPAGGPRAGATRADGRQRARGHRVARDFDAMKILIIGATGYIGSAVARALRNDGYDVSGLARSDASAARLREDRIRAVPGDMQTPATLLGAVRTAEPDIVLVAASAGGGAGDTKAFSADRDAILALTAGLEGRGKSLIFTSGSAVFGVFADGERADPAFDEATPLPLPRALFAAPSPNLPEAFATDLEEAVAARVQAERAVLTAAGVRGIVIRPGNVWGYGGSVDIPKAIEIARANGAAPYWGRGESLQGYVHLDDVVDLYRLAIASGRTGGVYHAVTEEVRQRDLAAAISRLTGAGDRTESMSLQRLHALGGTRGARLSVNKRLSADRTRTELRWSPVRADVLRDVEFGSYARGDRMAFRPSP